MQKAKQMSSSSASSPSPKWKPLAPKPSTSAEANGGAPQIPGFSREEMFQKCLVCSKEVPVSRNMVVVHCEDCSGRLNTFKNVFSSVEKVRTEASPPPVTTGLGLNPNLYRKASEMRSGKNEQVDTLAFGEMDWNSVGLIDRPLLNESLLDEDLTPRHMPLLETEKPKAASISAVNINKNAPGKTTTANANTNAKVIPPNARKVILIKNARGVLEVLEEKFPGKYVKCSDPQKVKKCIEASRNSNNGVKVKVGGAQGAPQKTQSFTLRPTSQPPQKHRLIAPKPPTTARILMPPSTLKATLPASSASPSRFIISMPSTAQGQVFQQKAPLAARSPPVASKPILEACGSMSCPLCQKSFWKRNALNVHVATAHKNSRAFCCSHCNTKFTLLINLINHKLQVHPHLTKFLCRSCGMETYDQNLFNKHISPNFVASFDCSCGEQFKKAILLHEHQKLTKHLSRNDRGLQVRPEFTNLQTPATPSLSASAPSLIPSNPPKKVAVGSLIPASVTPSIVSTAKQIVVEKAKVGKKLGLVPAVDLGLVPNGTIQCPTCEDGFYFAHAKYLDLHIEIRHAGAKILPCQFCQQKFSHLLDLISHKTNAHSKLSQWTCKLCGISFSNLQQSEYCAHLNTHSIVTNDCRCGMQFATEDGLEEHGRIGHQGITRFKCFEKRIEEFPCRSPGSESEPEAATQRVLVNNVQIQAKVPKVPMQAKSPVQLKSTPTPPKATPVKRKASPAKEAKTPSPVQSTMIVKTYGTKPLNTGAQSPTTNDGSSSSSSENTESDQFRKKKSVEIPPRGRGRPKKVTTAKEAEIKSSPAPADNKVKKVGRPKKTESNPPSSPEKAKSATPPKRKGGAEPTEPPAKRGRPAAAQSAAKKKPSKKEERTPSPRKSSADEIRRSGRDRKPKKRE